MKVLVPESRPKAAGLSHKRRWDRPWYGCHCPATASRQPGCCRAAPGATAAASASWRPCAAVCAVVCRATGAAVYREEAATELRVVKGVSLETRIEVIRTSRGLDSKSVQKDTWKSHRRLEKKQRASNPQGKGEVTRGTKTPRPESPVNSLKRRHGRPP